MNEEDGGWSQSRHEPCIGLCHYKKLLNEKKVEEDEQHYEKPCIGVCHHQRISGYAPQQVI